MTGSLRDSSGAPVKTPSFRRAPLYETVLGVRFPKIRSWQVPHFGLYWSQIREEYPQVETRPPLPSPSEGRPRIELVTTPDVRCWYLAETGSRLLQVQQDGFFYNWRRADLKETYPRYEHGIRPAFAAEWQRFTEFLGEEGLSVPETTECEITYVNHFEKGREWSHVSDLEGVLHWWSGSPPQTDLPSPSMIRLTTRHKVPPGVLDVSLTPAVRNQDGKEIFQFSLTVKGEPGSTSNADLMAWMDEARGCIVRAFSDLTTTEMHNEWEREE